MVLLQACKMAVHAIFATHFSAFGEMVNFLVTAERLVHLRLYAGTGPHDGPFLTAFGHFSEAVIFERVPHQRHIDTVVQFEVVTFIG